MSVLAILRKIQLRFCAPIFYATLLCTTLSGCASSLDRVVGGLFETVARTTVRAVGDVVIDVSAELLQSSFDMAIDSVIACIDNDKPVLRGALPNPALHQEYNATIQVAIRNEPYDSAYDYAFDVLGDLPPGMRTESTGRQLRLTGKPTSPGEYDFSVRVTVHDDAYGAKDTSGLCFTVDNESFQWTIEQNDYRHYIL